MISSPTPDILQNLKVVLNKIMKNGHTKQKYIVALDDAIKEIANTESEFFTAAFAVNIKEKEKYAISFNFQSAQVGDLK